MDVAATLETMRRDIGGCDLAALVDISTGMVLSSAQAVRLPQEELDALCARAAEALTGSIVESARGIPGQAPSMEAVLATAEGTTVCLRGSADRFEALVLLCTPDARIGQAIDCGRRSLGDIVSAE